MCNHNSRQEYHIGVMHFQQCNECGKIREYNPYAKKIRLANDPDLWSDWVEAPTHLKEIIK